MSEYYGNNDWRDYLAHSWGKKPEQKKREKEYNAWYWDTHKEEIMRKRGQKGKRPLAREKNVTGKTASVKRRGEGLNESNSINRRDENGLLNPPESFKSAINEMYKNYGKNGSYGDPYSANSAYSNFGEFQAEMMELGFKFNNDSEAKQAWISFKNNIDHKNGKTSKADKKEPMGNKLDKTDKPNRPNRPLAREKNIMGKGKGVHRRTDIIRDREKTKYLWDERRHDFVKNK